MPKVYGPYLDRQQGRRIVILAYDDGTRKTTAYARWLMEQHLGRTLDEDEEVDHIDEDKLNDTLSNLQVLPKADHRVKSGTRTYVEFVCPACGTTASKLASKIRHNRKQGKAGPFCSRSCAGRRSPTGSRQPV
jgi:predicted RNA-binding Zn-ribbon protein involved in translation (DUF1610 family)